VLDKLENLKSRSIPEKDWPSHTSSSGNGRVFDPKNVRYGTRTYVLSHPFKNFQPVHGTYSGYLKGEQPHAWGSFSYIDPLFAEDNFHF
jgi:hypothetical protein